MPITAVLRRPVATMSAEAPPRVPTVDESRAALARILASRTFERAPRLQEFLRFIGDLTLRGESERINESLIAIEVFQRTAYSPGDDSAVRRQAHALRSKLQRYYAEEGEQDPVRVELPLGRYVPVFRRFDEAPPPEPVPTPAASVPVPTPPRRAVTAALLGAGGLLTTGLGYLWGRSASSPGTPEIPAPLRALWSSWLVPGRRVLLCVSNPITFLVKPVPDGPTPDARAPEGQEGYPVTEEQEREYRKRLKMTEPGRLFLFPDPFSQAKQGELAAAVRLAGFFARAGVTTEVRQSRFMSMDVFAHEDVIVLGQDQNNPWVRELLLHHPMRLQAPTSTLKRHIVDTRARPGEESVFANKVGEGPDGLLEEHALLSMLPGLGQGRRLALVSGLGSPGSAMATDYLLDAERAKALLQALGAAGVAPGRPFQALLRVRSRIKLPMQGEIVRVRGV